MGSFCLSALCALLFGSRRCIIWAYLGVSFLAACFRSFFVRRVGYQVFLGQGQVSRKGRLTVDSEKYIDTMAKKLYVGNLSFSTTDDSLRSAFAQAGAVSSATIIMDRQSGRSKGFGFVEYENDAEADKAIEMWNGNDLDGRKLIVNVARPMEPRAPRGGDSFGGNDRRSW